MAYTPLKVIEGHRFWYQSKTQAVTHLRVSYGLRPRAAYPAALRPYALTSLPPPRVCLLAPDKIIIGIYILQ